MNFDFKITKELLREVHADLDRKHDFAYERVGFLLCSAATTAPDGVALLAKSYHPVADEDYIDDPSIGAAISGAAFRKIMQEVLNQSAAIVHVHRHDHRGLPRPSRVDRREYAQFMPDFYNICSDYPHAAVILSFDSANGWVWLPGVEESKRFNRMEVVGQHLNNWEVTHD